MCNIYAFRLKLSLDMTQGDGARYSLIEYTDIFCYYINVSDNRRCFFILYGE